MTPNPPATDRHREAARELAIDICRELYDRFVMGGWEPQDAHAQVEEMLAGYSPSGELAVAQARFGEYLLMKHKRPADPTYFDMHHEAELREAIHKAASPQPSGEEQARATKEAL